MRRPVILAGVMVAAAVWAAVAGVVAVRQWPSTGAAIARDRDAGVRGCAGRYPEPAARQRCADLFETQFVMERNVAMFNGLLVAAGPLAGVAVWAFATRAFATRAFAKRARRS